MSKPWPSSPLAAAQRAFELLICPPAPLAFDGRGFRGLPERILALDELKKILIHDSTSRPVRDRVWRELVIRARRDGPAWVVAAVGIALPGLRRMAGLLAAGWHGDTTDWDAELLAGFLARLRTIDLDEPRICGRLIDAGARAVKHAREREEETDTVRVEAAWSLPPHHPWDHPDWVLARAVAAAVIDPDEHLLIGATRLEDLPLQVVADKIGISVALAAAWRRKAERRLAGAIAAGELDWAPQALPDKGRRRTVRTAQTGATIAARTARQGGDLPPAPRASRAIRQVPAADRRHTPAVAGMAG